MFYNLKNIDNLSEFWEKFAKILEKYHYVLNKIFRNLTNFLEKILS